ncbi:hypothetical protein CPL0016902_CDS0043 [Escherichia phage tunus]|nr:hypothetical protein G3B1_069 [Escherichia phage vB_EcoS-G3B1]WQN06682.1 hypothetical protein [Escherichia phage vB-Eco-KMB46]
MRIVIMWRLFVLPLPVIIAVTVMYHIVMR